MIKRMLILTAFFTLGIDAKLNFSNIQGQKDFLNTLLKEIDESSQENKSEKDKEKNGIDKYKEDIVLLQKALFNIESENAKKGSDKKLLQDLIDDYNKKMKALENIYRTILLKRKKSKLKDEYLVKNSHKTVTMDSLNCDTKRRKIKDMKFRPLELVEVSNTSEIQRAIPAKDEK